MFMKQPISHMSHCKNCCPDIGGTMGLFAGISIISLVEAAYCAVVMVVKVAGEVFGRRRRRTK